MNTKYALHARFGTPIVALGDICEEFFHINAETANGKANSQSLPIPVFRMEEHKRSPFMVHLNDLATHIDACREQVLTEWQEKAVLAALSNPQAEPFRSPFIDVNNVKGEQQ
ncbi:pyocin activator PrtN family protein [Vibrio ouci]|uniref:Pyocin activator protein PrtN n=1 Tax=Vibrio ouci TaxID=2499078 RepID=A0A4Y8WAX9_9VIBR|nr:pyocin activator PrtN family protein [Vibrio ouci]TFH90089.1 hypothetical protein ELS82_18580 [Vibrio ouci]